MASSSIIPSTVDWVTVWRANDNVSLGTDQAFTFNKQDFTITASGGTVNSYGSISTVKQTVNNSSQYWWGYTT